MTESSNFVANLGWFLDEFRDISQGEFADKAEISRGYLNRVLTDEKNPTLKVCTKIAAACNEVLDTHGMAEIRVTIRLLLSDPTQFKKAIQNNLQTVS